MEVKITLEIRDKNNNLGHISFMGNLDIPTLNTTDGYLPVKEICGMIIDCIPDRS